MSGYNRTPVPHSLYVWQLKNLKRMERQLNMIVLVALVCASPLIASAAVIDHHRAHGMRFTMTFNSMCHIQCKGKYQIAENAPIYWYKIPQTNWQRTVSLLSFCIFHCLPVWYAIDLVWDVSMLTDFKLQRETVVNVELLQSEYKCGAIVYKYVKCAVEKCAIAFFFSLFRLFVMDIGRCGDREKKDAETEYMVASKRKIKIDWHTWVCSIIRIIHGQCAILLISWRWYIRIFDQIRWCSLFSCFIL